MAWNKASRAKLSRSMKKAHAKKRAELANDLNHKHENGGQVIPLSALPRPKPKPNSAAKPRRQVLPEKFAAFKLVNLGLGSGAPQRDLNVEMLGALIASVVRHL